MCTGASNPAESEINAYRRRPVTHPVLPTDMPDTPMRNGLLLTITLLTVSTYAQGDDPSVSFGQRQLAQVLTDRPNMTGVLPDDDVICRWVIRRFNSGPNGERVRWDRQEPMSGRPAENLPAQNHDNALVRITSSADVSGRDKWFMLVFELHNIPHPEAAGEMSRLVREQRIGRLEFALGCVEHEYRAMRKTTRFFSRYPIPDATRKNAPLYIQYTNRRAKHYDFDAYVKHLDTIEEDQYDPREYFGKWYDQLRAYHFSGLREIPKG